MRREIFLVLFSLTLFAIGLCVLQSFSPLYYNVYSKERDSSLQQLSNILEYYSPVTKTQIDYPSNWQLIEYSEANMTLLSPPDKPVGVIIESIPLDSLFMDNSNKKIFEIINSNFLDLQIIGDRITKVSDGSTIRALLFNLSDEPNSKKILIISKTNDKRTILFAYYSDGSNFASFLPSALVILDSIHEPNFAKIFTFDTPPKSSPKSIANHELENITNSNTRNETNSVVPSFVENPNSNILDNNIGNETVNLAVYNSKSLGFSIQYPDSFYISEKNNRVTFTSPDYKAKVTISVLPSFNNTENQYSSGKIKSIQTLSNLDVVNLDQSDIFGFPTQMVLYEYTDSDETKKFKTMELWKQKNNLVQNFNFNSEIESYDQYLPIVIKILDTIRWAT